MDTLTKIKDVELHEIRLAKKVETKVKVTMSMGKDLIGNFTVQDTFTKSKASITFDGGEVF
jgi:hypothetical protein